METILIFTIGLLGITAYATAVYQMLTGVYTPSFFSRGVWFLLGVNSLIGVLLSGGSKSSVVLAGTLFVGSLAVFITSYKKGSREFGNVEKISLLLLVISASLWIFLDAPYLSLIINLSAHFIGGIPTIWRVAKRPYSEQAYHWYFFFAASVLSIFNSDGDNLRSITFPVYFVFFDGLIILLANRKRLVGSRAR